KRIAALVVAELFEQRSAEALGEAADDLSLDQRRIDGTPDIICDDVPFDMCSSGVAVDFDHGEMDSVGIDLWGDAKPAFGGEPGLTVAQHLRSGRQMLGDCAEADRGP